jgi:hypothetical protein
VVSGRSHYEVLGVAADSTTAEIRTAYLRLARRHHPDRHVNGGPAERRAAEAEMRRVNQAWQVLREPSARAAYDLTQRGPRGGRRLRTDRHGSGEWEPFDPSDGPDPRDLADDRPITGARPVPRWLTMAPPAIVLLSVVTFGAAMITGVASLFGLAVTGLVLAGVGFFVVPLVALTRAARDDSPRPSR